MTDKFTVKCFNRQNMDADIQKSMHSRGYHGECVWLDGITKSTETILASWEQTLIL